MTNPLNHPEHHTLLLACHPIFAGTAQAALRARIIGGLIRLACCSLEGRAWRLQLRAVVFVPRASISDTAGSPELDHLAGIPFPVRGIELVDGVEVFTALV